MRVQDLSVSIKDKLALIIAFFQILIPYILISVGVFGFLTWLLVMFWVK